MDLYFEYIRRFTWSRDRYLKLLTPSTIGCRQRLMRYGSTVMRPANDESPRPRSPITLLSRTNSGRGAFHRVYVFLRPTQRFPIGSMLSTSHAMIWAPSTLYWIRPVRRL